MKGNDKEGGKRGKQGLLVELSGNAGSQRVSTAGKVGQPHSCVLASRDPPHPPLPEIGVTVFHCQGEKKEEKH